MNLQQLPNRCRIPAAKTALGGDVKFFHVALGRGDPFPRSFNAVS
jgi:hypothetical protein